MANFLANPNIQTGLRAIAIASATYLGATACTNNNPEVVRPTTTTRPLEIPTTPPADTRADLDPTEVNREAAQQYVISAERNNRIDSIVQDAGQRFVVACQTGEAGPCDIYSGNNKAWRSQSTTAIEPGWAWLQHNPQYGGQDIQFSTTVWVDENWNIDTSKGIRGISVSDANGSFGFTAPGGNPGVTDSVVVHPNSWEATSKPHDQDKVDVVSESGVFNSTLLEMQITDETAISLLENFRQMHNLQ